MPKRLTSFSYVEKKKFEVVLRRVEKSLRAGGKNKCVRRNTFKHVLYSFHFDLFKYILCVRASSESFWSSYENCIFVRATR